MTTPRYICIHGHFYQPPRENPWIETIEPQPSAAPFADWNERVHSQCYAPNSCARILGADGRIAQVVNNYETISFNFGPTLLSWMRDNDAATWRRLREADERSCAARNGHGNALAQVYNHVIMPLANERDRELQVHWGIEDFRYHFGRDPEGMWLAECAVDTPTLETLAAAGIRFTILAPHQARAIRPLDGNGKGTGDWHSVGESIDPTRAWKCELPSGRSIALFFYDGPISRAVAFEGLLSSGTRFARRLLEGFSDSRHHAQLLHIATDGESYGHHHTHGDMALAAALLELQRRDGVTVTNYAEFLERHPPQMAVQIAEPTAWSCAHGIERWRSDCGCRTRADWNQQWRSPLRKAFDWLRDRADALFADAGAVVLRDPWAARLDYIHLLHERNDDDVATWMARHLIEPSRADDRVRALRLLEMQRHVQLMYTSCAWFFDEISGLEAVQTLRYAARVIELAAGFGAMLNEEFQQLLAAAPSNIPRFADGRAVWSHHVAPSVVSPLRLAAHVVVQRIFGEDSDVPSDATIFPEDSTAPIYTHIVEQIAFTQRGGTRQRLVVGRVRTRDRITHERHNSEFALLDFGNLDFHCGVRTQGSDEAWRELGSDLLGLFDGQSVTQVLRRMDHHFRNGEFFALADLFQDSRQAVLDLSTRDTLARVHGVYMRLYEDHRRLMEFSRRLDLPVPPVLGVAVGYVLTAGVQQLIAEPPSDPAVMPSHLDRLITIIEEARHWGLQLPTTQLGAPVSKLIQLAVANVDLTAPRGPATLARLARLVGLLQQLGVQWDPWGTQNELVALLNAGRGAHSWHHVMAPETRAAAMESLEQLVAATNLAPSLLPVASGPGSASGRRSG
ncbi:MAG: DUF3536 domain-containing protein [Planctomycetota bacterium]